MKNFNYLAFDLDGTLAPSKSILQESMAKILGELLETKKIAVISGASFEQYNKQFVAYLPVGVNLENLLLAPTNGAEICIFQDGAWSQKEKHWLAEEEKKIIMQVLQEALQEFGVSQNNTYGPQIEDRKSQITFSGCGQRAPLEIKKTWDPEAKLRKQIADYVSQKLPNLSVRIGGMTSVDITQKGIDKEYALNRIFDIWQIAPADLLFVGDALFEGGNDEPAKKTGCETLQVQGPSETEKVLQEMLKG